MHARATPAQPHREGSSLSQLLARVPQGRLPLDIALQITWAVTTAVREMHSAGAVLGGLDLTSIEVRDDGTVVVWPGRATAPEAARHDGLTCEADVHALGAAVFQVLSGLTVTQARARESVVRLDAPPPPSRFNPAVDECLDGLVLSMLLANPRVRPTIVLVEEQLAAALEELGVEPSARELSAWLTVGTAKAKPKLRHVPPAWADDEGPDDTLDDEDDEVVVQQTGRLLDGWSVSLVAFGLAAMLFAMRL